MNNACMMCGEEMTRSVESCEFDALPGTTLLELSVYRCSECGEYEVEYPRLSELMDTLTTAVVMSPKRLNGRQIRFLRTFVELSQGELADRLGLDPSTLSRCESGRQPMGVSTDRLLRVMCAWNIDLDGFASKLGSVAVDDAGEWHARLRFDDGWHVVEDAPTAEPRANFG